MSEMTKMGGLEEVHLADGSSVFLCGSFTMGVKWDYIDWMESRARKRVFQLKKKKLLDEDEYHESLRTVQECASSGTFMWGGPAWQASFNSMPGQFYAIHLLALHAARDLPSGPVPANDPVPQASDVVDYFKDKDVSKQFVDALGRIINSDPNFVKAPPEVQA